MKARLHNKFIRVFIFPLIFGILISITFTVIALLYFAHGLSTSDNIITIVREADNNKTEPIIANIKNILFRKIQTPVNALIAIKQHYIELATSGNLEMNDTAHMKAFIDKYMPNSLNIIANYDATITEMSSNNNETFLDYSAWFLDKTTSSTDGLSDLYLKQLYIQANLNLVFRSHYEVNKEITRNRYPLMYTSYVKSKIFTLFPIYARGVENFDFLINAQYPSWCRNSDFEVPTYFYFPCRPWFEELLYLNSIDGLNAIMSTPYLSTDGKIETAVCIRFDDPLVDPSSATDEDYIVICVDMDITDIFYVLDEYNNLLSGYYYLMRINSDVPIYYPNIVKNGYTGILRNYEFKTRNFSFFIDDITSFQEPLTNFIANYNETGHKYISTGTFQRGGQNITYNLYPIFYYLDKNPSIPQHLLTVVYLSTSESYMNTIYKFQKNLYPRLAFQIFVFALMGGILILISRYLIISIAFNIVKPIRLMKRMLEGMNNKKLLQISVDNGNAGIIGANLENYEGFSNDAVDNLHYDEINTHDEEELETIKEEENIEDEDEYIETRSTDIDNLFITLMNLKRVLAFTQDTSLTVNQENLLNYLFARHTFQEVKNLKRKFLCDSNVGNLTLKCKKYDKAIFHLVESMQDPHFSLSAVPKKSLQSLIKSKRTKTHSKLFKNPSKIGANLFDKDKRKVELTKKKFLESRYPKLIYSYKKYYKNLNRLLKNQTIYNFITEQDFFALRDRHSLEYFEKTIEDYFKLAESCQDKTRQAEAILELIEFQLSYRLKSNRSSQFEFASSTSYAFSLTTPEEIKQTKEQVIIKIAEEFRIFDSIICNLLGNTDVDAYMKNIVEMIKISRKDSFEIIQTPVYVLNQRANYLKGKFCYYCENFTQALKFFNQCRKVVVIANAEIIRDSIKKAKKILHSIVNRAFSQIEEIPSLLAYEKSAETIKHLNQQLPKLHETADKATNFLKILDQEITKYRIVSKDILVLINFSMIHDSKQIDQAMGLSEYIFENLVTSDDRFALFSYTSYSNPLLNLCFKNISTIDYILDQISLISKKEFYEEYMDDSSANLPKALENAFNYLSKKAGNGEREKWIIVLTDEISLPDSDYLRHNNIKENLFDNEDSCNLIIIKTTKDNKDMDLNYKSLHFNKSALLEIDNIELLKKKMSILGNINDDSFFVQEKYDNNDKNY